MAGIPYIPSSAPFTPEQRAWLNGYLAGLFADANLGEPGVARQTAPAKPSEPLLVLYGSQSGTAEGLAKKFAKEATAKGFEPRVMELNAAAQLDLTKEPRAVIITSTWGDGEPPDNATAFWTHIAATLRRSWRTSATPCSRLATRTTRNSAAPEKSSTNAWKNLAPNESILASIAIWTTKRRRRDGWKVCGRP